MIITEEEIIKHATAFFTVMRTGGTAAEVASFFLNPSPRIYLTDTGVSISMEELHELHKHWKWQTHEFSLFTIMPLNAEPARVRTMALHTGKPDLTIWSSRSRAWSEKTGF